MAQNVQITCVKKNDRGSIHERITSIGGKNSDGSSWFLPLADAIKGIDDGKWSFYVSVSGLSVWVIVAKTASGYRYLRTTADGEEPNNLMSLPECT